MWLENANTANISLYHIIKPYMLRHSTSLLARDLLLNILVWSCLILFDHSRLFWFLDIGKLTDNGHIQIQSSIRMCHARGQHMPTSRFVAWTKKKERRKKNEKRNKKDEEGIRRRIWRRARKGSVLRLQRVLLHLSVSLQEILHLNRTQKESKETRLHHTIWRGVRASRYAQVTHQLLIHRINKSPEAIELAKAGRKHITLHRVCQD